MTEEDRQYVVLGTLNNSMGVAKLIGASNMAHCLIDAGLKLLLDVEAPAAAWAQLRDKLAEATDHARDLAHPKPQPVD